jgi:hypothetical protein
MPGQLEDSGQAERSARGRPPGQPAGRGGHAPSQELWIRGGRGPRVVLRGRARDLRNGHRLAGPPGPEARATEHNRRRNRRQPDRQGASDDHPRKTSGGQSGDLVAAGHEYQAAGRAGQQRAELPPVGGVVEQDQYPPPGQQAAAQPGLGCQAGRDLPGWHAKGAREPADRLRRGRSTGGIGPAKVHMELTDGGTAGYLVCQCTARGVLPAPAVPPVQGEGGNKLSCASADVPALTLANVSH